MGYAWDVFRRTSSRVGRRRRDAVTTAVVDFAVLGAAGFRVIFFVLFSSWNAHGLLLA